MSAALDELDSFFGIKKPDEEKKSTSTAASATLSELDSFFGISTKPPKQDEATDSFIGVFLKNTLAKTSVGIAARATGAVDYEPKSQGIVGDIGSEIGSFVIDPATYLTGGLGSIIGKGAAKKLVAYAAEKGLIGAAARVAPAAIHAGVQLGGLEAVREAAGGEFHPGQIAKATVAGAALGPAGAIANPIGRAAAEVGAMAAVPPLLEGRLPGKEDWIAAAGTVGGLKLARLVGKAITGKKPIAEEVAAEVGPDQYAQISKIIDLTQFEQKPQAVKEPSYDPTTEHRRFLQNELAAQNAPTQQQFLESATGEKLFQPRLNDAGPGTPEEQAAILASQKGAEAVPPRQPLVPLKPSESVSPEWAAQFRALYPEQAAKIENIEGNVKAADVAFTREPGARVPLRSAKQEHRNQLRDLLKGQTDAVEKRKQPQNDLGQYQNGSQGGPAGQTSGGNRSVQGGQVPQAQGEIAKAPESPKIAAARAKLETSVEEYRKHTQGQTPALFDPKTITLIARVTKDELGLGWAKFSDYVASLARKLGSAFVRTHAALIRDTWEEHRKDKPALDAAGDVEPILTEAKIPDYPVDVARPDLAVPARGRVSEGGLNVADTIRNAVGLPEPMSHARAEAIADRRIAETGPQDTQRLIDSVWVASDSPETIQQVKILKALRVRAVESRTNGDWKDFFSSNLNFRQGGTEQAQAFEARKYIKGLSQPEQQAFFAAEALAQPPREVEKRIIKAQNREQRAKAVAPEGFAAPQELTSTKPRTERQLAADEKPKANTAEALRKAWAGEIEKVRATLAGRGFNVDAALNGELDPVNQEEFIAAAHAAKASVPDKLYEWWNNAILSGPATQTTNAIGNAAHGTWYFTAERITDAVVSSIARAGGFKSDGARFGELKHIYRAFIENWGKSAKNFFETWHSEVPQFYAERGLEEQTAYGYRRGSILGRKSKLIPKWLASDTGQLVRAPWRLLAAVDDFFKGQFFAMEQSSLAYRYALAENPSIGKEALMRRMRELTASPDSEVNLRSVDTAIRLSFQEKWQSAKNFQKLVHGIPGGRYVLPFITTPFNILRAGVRKSPFGSIKLADEMLKAHESGDWTHVPQRAAEQVLAWGATLALAYMNDPKDPFITGSKGSNPYSLKIGGKWWNYGRIEPFATTLGLLIDGINKIHEGGDLFESLKAPFDALLERVDNQTFFQGISDFTKAVRYQKADYALDWAAKFPASWVPNLVRAPLRAAVDEVPQRRVWGTGEQRAELSLKRGLQAFEVMPDYPKYDLWGRTVPKDGLPIPHTDWLWRTLSPVGERRYTETIGDRVLTRWNAGHPDEKEEFKAPNPYFVEHGKTFQFTDEEYAAYVRESGRLTQQRVIAAQAAGGFNVDEPKERDIERLRKIIETSRERIRNTIKRSRREAGRNAA